jgi:tRNA pseudouridine55 synthase
VFATADDLVAATARFTGRIRQVPPMHSALKKDGKALYEYARAGIEVEREAREVQIYALNMAFAEESPPHTAIKIIVKCSKGTYIRTLGEDVGAALGCGAHLTALRRTGTGGFGLQDCVTLAQLEAMDEEQRLACLLPVEALLPGHVRVTLAQEDAERFLSGLRRRGSWPDAECVAVFGEQHAMLLGSAFIQAGELIPRRLLSPLELRQMSEHAFSACL